MSEAKYCLLLENDPDDQDLFIDVLHKITAHAGCYAAPTTEEALFTLQHQNFSPDYIFVNPYSNGIEFIRSIRDIDKYRPIPIIVLSPDNATEKLQEVKQLGVTEFYARTSTTQLEEILKHYFLEVA